MTTTDLKAKYQELLNELLSVALNQHEHHAIQHMEVLHKRLNAINRYLAEVTPPVGQVDPS